MSSYRSNAFALTPSHNRTNDVLDFNNKDDIKYYLTGDKPLFSEHGDKFDCTPDNLNNFLQDMDDRSQEYGWYYNGTGIACGNRSVVMIDEAPYSTGANGVRAVNKSDNVRSMSQIRDHGKIIF